MESIAKIDFSQKSCFMVSGMNSVVLWRSWEQFFWFFVLRKQAAAAAAVVARAGSLGSPA